MCCIVIALFPTCQVRAVRFYVSLLLPSSFVAVLVFFSREPHACSSTGATPLSVPHLALTATFRAQCFFPGPQPRPFAASALPKLNCDLLCPVLPARPQPQERMPRRMSEDMPETLLAWIMNIKRYMSERMLVYMFVVRKCWHVCPADSNTSDRWYTE